MRFDEQELEQIRRELGETDAPVEDAVATAFHSSVREGAERLARSWRVQIITGLVGGIDVCLGIIAMLAVLDATGSILLAVLAGTTITLVTRMAKGTDNDVVTAFISLIGGFLVVGTGMIHGVLDAIIIFGAIHLGTPISYADVFG